MRQLTAALGLVFCCAALAGAQRPWPARLSPATRDTLERLADSVSAAKLPAEPLVSKAAEGVLKGADDARIVRAVRALVRELADARSALPAGADAATLSAAASALHAGVSTERLRRLAASASSPNGGDLAVALVAVADLVASQVPAEAAASAIEQLLRRRARDSEISAFRQGVAQDILGGRTPEAALDARTRTLVRNLEGRGGGVLSDPARPQPRPPR